MHFVHFRASIRPQQCRDATMQSPFRPSLRGYGMVSWAMNLRVTYIHPAGGESTGNAKTSVVYNDV
eukprot:scaffold7386_cov160-Amphora_coffeaeformis.AAC.5